MTAAIELTGVGGDLVYLAITVVFFALAVLLVRACEHIAGAEPPSTQTEPSTAEPQKESRS